MHQNPPFSGKNSIFFWGGTAPPQTPPLDRPPPIIKVLDPPLFMHTSLRSLAFSSFISYDRSISPAITVIKYAYVFDHY